MDCREGFEEGEENQQQSGVPLHEEADRGRSGSTHQNGEIIDFTGRDSGHGPNSVFKELVFDDSIEFPLLTEAEDDHYIPGDPEMSAGEEFEAAQSGPGSYGHGLFGTSYSFTRLFGIRKSIDNYRHDEESGETLLVSEDRDEEQSRHSGSLTQLFGSLVSNGFPVGHTSFISEVEVYGDVEEVPGGVFARILSLTRLFGSLGRVYEFDTRGCYDSRRLSSICSASEYQSLYPIMLHRPRFLWFLKSEEEESRYVHRTINAIILNSAALIAFSCFISIDRKHWDAWSLRRILRTMIPDNWSAYKAALDRHPIPTKMIISGCVYTLGNWIAQCYEGAPLLEVHRSRAFKSGLVGFFLHGPLSHFYYHFCELLFPWNAWWVVPLKVVFDQTFWAGVWNSVYYVMLGLLRLESLRSILYQLRATFVALTTAGWKLWPLAHIITYGVIPVEQRLAWVDLVEVIWVIVLSIWSNQRQGRQLNRAVQPLERSEANVDRFKNGVYEAIPDR